MAAPKTLRDIKTVRSIVTRAAPTSESGLWLQLHRLASEKQRIEREADLWLRKKQRLDKRLGEIEQQMERLRQTRPGPAAEARVDGTGKDWRHVTLEY